MHRTLPPTTLLAALLACLLMSACATKPLVEYDRTADFSQYKTFDWKERDYGKVEDPILDSPLLGQKVRQAAVASLQGSGFTQAGQNSDADFLVTYHTAEKERHSNSGLSIGFATGYWGRSSVIYTANSGQNSYEEGMLIVDILDAESGNLVWRGWRGMRLSQQNFNDANVRKQVELILSAFPPGKR